MCASLDFPSLGWKWEPNLLSVHVYWKMLWDNKYKEDYELIFNVLFSTLYQFIFGEEAPCLSPEGKNIVKEYGDLYMTLDRVYIRIVGNTKPLHWLQTLYMTHCFFKRYLIKHMWMVWLHIFTRTRKVFGLHFHWSHKFQDQ